MQTIVNTTVAALVFTSIFAVVPAAADAEPDDPKVECEGDTRTDTNEFYGEVDYSITYNYSTYQMCVVATNAGNRSKIFRYNIEIDDHPILESNQVKLAPNDEFRETRRITGAIDATRVSHTITVTSHNNTHYFNFTKDMDPMNEDGVPTPHIEKVTILRNGTESGKPEIKVRVENKGNRSYSPEAVVKTFESNLRWMRGGSSLGGQYHTRLSEAEDDVILGTVKLYGDTYYSGTKWDRVSFVSYPNGTYETWEPEFREIPTKREIEEREVYYENETAREKYAGPDVDPISERASKVGAVLVTALVVGGLWYWRRR